MTTIRLPAWPAKPVTHGSIVLREFSDADLPMVQELSADSYVPLIGTLPPNATRQEARDYIDRQRGRLAEGIGFSFAIAEAGTGRSVGGIGLWLAALDQGRATAGYSVIPSARGRGVASAALTALAFFAWTIPELHRIELYIEPWNIGSVKSAERAGFQREGLLRSHQEIGGHRRDMLLYATVRENPPVPHRPAMHIKSAGENAPEAPLAEEQLDGGNTGGAVRAGDTVRRAAGPWTPTVHALLAHLAAKGFTGAPRPLGLDEQGREVLTFLEGETVGSAKPCPAWTHADDTLDQVAHWMRAYHQAVADFTPPPGAVWREGGTWSPGLIIGHNDTAPYNAAWHQGALAGIRFWCGNISAWILLRPRRSRSSGSGTGTPTTLTRCLPTSPTMSSSRRRQPSACSAATG